MQSDQRLDDLLHALRLDYRRWAVQQMTLHGTVTIREVQREFPSVTPRVVSQMLGRLADAGICTKQKVNAGPGHFGGDTTQEYRLSAKGARALRELHTYLSPLVTALSPTPEVPSEAHP